MRHPSALNKFEQIISASKGKQIAMFLDYDGTLSPIVEDPDSAFMTDAVSRAPPPPCFPLFPWSNPFHSMVKDGILIVVCLWESDERCSEESREVLPHGDRQWAVPRQGTFPFHPPSKDSDFSSVFLVF